MKSSPNNEAFFNLFLISLHYITTEKMCFKGKMHLSVRIKVNENMTFIISKAHYRNI